MMLFCPPSRVIFGYFGVVPCCRPLVFRRRQML